MIIQANEQAYQSIYLNPEATKWQEVIVFHEPIFEQEMAGVIALKSLRLENCYGLVVGAPLNKIRYLREKVKDMDKDEKWGQLDIQQIYKKLCSIIDELQGDIVYTQIQLEGPNDKVKCVEKSQKKKLPKKQETNKNKVKKQITEQFFDPMTKRQIVKKGPHYFDPSLPKMPEEEKTIAKSETIAKADFRIYAPGIKRYPEDISQAGKQIWNNINLKFGKQIIANIKDNWTTARWLYERECSEYGIEPYRIKSILKDMPLGDHFKDSMNVLQTTLVEIMHSLDCFKTHIQQENLHSIQYDDDIFCLTTSMVLPLTENFTSEILTDLVEKHDFRMCMIEEKNVYKKFNQRSLLTFKEHDDKIKVFKSYIIPCEELKIVFDTEDADKIKQALTKFLYKFLKTRKVELHGKFKFTVG